jgi:RNA polymerase sigma-70 factor (ECF subfamily)
MDENQWIAEARDGSTEAFGRLVGTHQKQLFGFLCSYTGREDVADDLTQETFLKAWRGMGTFRSESRFQTWLFQIGLNTLRSWSRRDTLRRWREQALEVWGRDDEAPSSSPLDRAPDLRSDADPQRVLEKQGRAARARKAVAGLPPKEKTVFLLRHEQGMALLEIARVMGAAEGTVKAHLFHATQKLRKQLEELL